MKRRILTTLLLLMLFVGIVSSAAAHDSQSEHDKDLKLVLFGSRDKLLSGDEKEAFRAIANAAALTIDQFSANATKRSKEKEYNDLQSELQMMGLPELPVDFDSIDLNCKVTKDGKNITANTHRKYTHLGWNYNKYPDAEFWKRRKQILLHTVNWTLFNSNAAFSWLPWVSDALYSPSEQCEAFCALVYYIHILGDHIGGDKPEKMTNIEPLIQYTNMTTPGIIAELKEQLQIVFFSQITSWTYAGLIQELTSLEIKAEQNCATWGAVDTEEKCKKNQEYAKELLEILSRSVPNLLKNEPFFADHFNPKSN